jgi:hypothetical protein
VQLAGGVGAAGDPYERQADAAADAVVAGRSAAPIIESSGSSEASSGGGNVQREAAPSQVNAALYLSTNHRVAAPAIAQYLMGVPWPAPHPRLQWRGADVFKHALVEQLVTALGGFSKPHHVNELFFPARPYDVVDEMRPITGASGAAVAGDGLTGGPVGPHAWHASIGVALGQLAQATIADSLHRLAARWLARADADPAAHHLVDAPFSIVGFDQLVTSHPMDLPVGKAITSTAVFAYQAPAKDPHAKAKRNDDASRVPGLRAVKVEWQGARSPKLWNWVKATPADATVEEVAAALYQDAYGVGESFHAYALTEARPLFGLPAEWAKHFADAARFAPKSKPDDAGAEHGVLAAASSPAAHEIALEQASGAAGATARDRSPAVVHALDSIATSRIELMFLLKLLAPWGLDPAVGIALTFVELKNAEVMTASDAELARWRPILDGQKANLARIGGIAGQVAEAANAMGATDPKSANAHPLHEILSTLAEAAGASHFLETCPRIIAKALRLQQGLTLRAVQGSVRDASSAIDAMREVMGDDGPGDPSRQLSQRYDAVDERSRQMQSKLVNGQAVDADELEEVTLEADEIALEARAHGLATELHTLKDAANEAGDGLWAELAAIPSVDFRAMRAALPALEQAVEDVRNDLNHQRAIGELGLSGFTSAAKRAAAVRQIRRDALSRGQAAFAKLRGRKDIVELLQHGANLIKWQGFRTACAKVLALIGVGFIAGAAGGVVARTVGGFIDGAAGAQAIVELSTSARLVGGASGFAVDAGLNTLGQRAMNGPGEEGVGAGFLENLLITMGSAGVLKALSHDAEIVAAVERQSSTIWERVGRGGIVMLKESAAISGHAILGAALGYASHLLVTHKTQPPPETIQEWFLQGASIAVGRYLHAGLQSRIERLQRLSHAKGFEAGARLLGRTKDLSTRARQLESAGAAADPHAALELLARHHEQLVEEAEALEALSRDHEGMAAAGVTRTDVLGMREDVRGGLDESNDGGVAAVTFQLAGLHEVVPGQIWRGTHDEVQIALVEARRAGAHVEASYDAAGHRWQVKVSGHSQEIYEPVDAAAPTSHAPEMAHLESVPPLEQIEDVTGVKKGPDYAEAMARLHQFYAQMEQEARTPVHVQGRRTDGPAYAWQYGHDARELSHGLTHVTFRVYLDGTTNGVPPAEIASLKRNVMRGVDRYYNFQHEIVSSGGAAHRLHVEVEFVEAASDAHLVVNVHRGDGRALGTQWYVEGHPTTHAHEVGHTAFGLPDEYYDPAAPSRNDPSSPAVRSDGSLMADYREFQPDGSWDAAPATGLRARHLNEIGDEITDHKRSGEKAPGNDDGRPAPAPDGRASNAARLRERLNAPKIAAAKAMSFAERQEYLGTHSGSYDPVEGEVGAMMEQRFGWFVRSVSAGADWVSLSGPYAGKSFDHMGPRPGKPYVLKETLASLKIHVGKVDYVILDLRYMTASDRQAAVQYLESNHPEALGRVFPLGDL